MNAYAIRRGGFLWLVLATASLLLFSVYSLRQFGGTIGHEVFGRWLNAAIGLTPGLYCLGRAIARREERLAWTLLGIGTTGWGLGSLYYLTVLYNADVVPIPSPADVGYLAIYPFAYCGLLLLMKNRLTGFRKTLWLDGLIGALAVATIAVAVVFQQVAHSASGGAASVATNLAYPLGDSLMIAFVVLVYGMTGWRPGREWLLIACGFGLFFAGDSAYLVETAHGTYAPGHLLDASWPAGMLLIAWAASRPTPARKAVRADGLITLAMPAVFLSSVVALETWDHYYRLATLPLVLMTLTLIAAVARLGVTFVENLGMLRHSQTEALTDPLTQLGNRRRLLADLDAAFARPDSQHRLLMLLDLNGFKHYNDSFGHLAGDALLARLATRFEAVIGERGVAYRLGGDEFCALLPLQADASDAVIAEIAGALSEQGDGFDIDASYGAVMLPEGAAGTVDALRTVDHRMYAQKHAGRLSAREQSTSVLLQALAERHPELGAHMQRVSELAGRVATRLGLEGDDIRQIRIAAALHDIGKVAVPDTILDNPGPLSPAELSFIHKHTVIGERIMQAAAALGAPARLVRSSHERMDGKGYPDGLAGAEIPIGSRIIFVCDAYDAMRADRPYAAARTASEAMVELEACSGTQFDADVVVALRDELAAGSVSELAA